MKYLALFIVLYTTLFSEQGVSQFQIEKTGSYSIVIEDEFILPQLYKAAMDDDGSLYYCDLQNILVFDDTGKFIRKAEQIGRGPGEFQTLINCKTSGNYFAVLPFNEFKAILYERDGTDHLELTLKNFRTKNFTLINDSLFVTINEVGYGESDKALAIYDISSNTHLGAIHDTPPMAYVGKYVDGTYITSDAENVYFSYLSYPGIWRYSISNQEIDYWSSTPDYFIESDISELESLKKPDSRSYIEGYMYSHSTGISPISVSLNPSLAVINRFVLS
ncbi:MAG: 6-bladed beta-propeller [Balneolaceae bacterium]|nr:6-bladed beta-propeller [Balneolaceae bacterium]